jgi:ABC-type polysaccharide/polyol phosphate export permease
MTGISQSSATPGVQHSMTQNGGLRGLFHSGVQEVAAGLATWRIWHLIGSAEIRRRYARSSLGQAWLVLSMAATVAALGWLWSTLWRMPLEDMLVYVGTSLVLWQFVSGVINDSATAFVSNAHYFMNQRIAPATIIFAVVYRNLLVLAHNVLIIIVLAVWLGPLPDWRVVWLVPAIALVLILCFWGGYLLAALCVRFRDVVQLASIAVQFGFFFTPILWKLEQAPAEARYFLALNPLHHIMDLWRALLIGGMPAAWSWIVVGLLSLVGLLLALPLIGWLRSRIVYWL